MVATATAKISAATAILGAQAADEAVKAFGKPIKEVHVHGDAKVLHSMGILAGVAAGNIVVNTEQPSNHSAVKVSGQHLG